MVMNKEEARYRRNNDKEVKTSDKDPAEHVFIAPASKPPKKNVYKKSSTISGKMKSPHEDSKPKNETNLLHYKLSPKVFGVPRPVSMSFENLSTSSSKRRSLFGSRKKNKGQDDEVFSIWGSLQELRQSDVLKQPQHANFLEGTYSEPSLNQNLDEVSQKILHYVLLSPFLLTTLLARRTCYWQNRRQLPVIDRKHTTRTRQLSAS